MKLAAKRNYSPGFAGYRNFTCPGKEPLIRFLFILIMNNENKKQDTHKNILPHNSWRSGGDSNPRTGDPSNDLANRPLQPLEYRSA